MCVSNHRVIATVGVDDGHLVLHGSEHEVCPVLFRYPDRCIVGWDGQELRTGLRRIPGGITAQRTRESIVSAQPGRTPAGRMSGKPTADADANGGGGQMVRSAVWPGYR